MKKLKIAGIAALALALGVPCTTIEGMEQETIAKNSSVIHTGSLEQRLDNYIEQMTLREKVGQMVIMVSYGDHCNGNVGKYGLGGTFFIGKRHASTLNRMVGECNASADIPVLALADEESGTISRIKKNGYPYKSHHIRKGEDPAKMAYELAFAIGAKMNEAGLNGNLAPLLDVYSPKSAIGFRNFHGDKEVLVEVGREYARGLHEQGIIATGKHYPGYGDTRQHSDHELAVNHISEEDLINEHRRVFDQLKPELDMIMVSNVIYSNVDENPVLFSKKIVGWAREDFDGVIISDDLLAKSLTAYLGGDEKHRQRAVLAVKAGVDLLIDRANAYNIVDAIADAVEAGDIPEEQIDDSVMRILKLKHKYAGFEP